MDMRKILLGIGSLSAALACGPAYSLDASDTMSSWKGASAMEKSGLVAKLLSKSERAIQSRVISCVDAAAAVPVISTFKSAIWSGHAWQKKTMVSLYDSFAAGLANAPLDTSDRKLT